MSGLNRRRTSGEIINATLLEVFLALVFVVFGVAVFEQLRATDAEGKLAGVLTADEARDLNKSLQSARDSVDALMAALRSSSDTLVAAQERIKQLLYDSPYPPDCEVRASPPWRLTVTLGAGASLEVVAHRPSAGMPVGVPTRMSIEQFKSRFASLRDSGRTHGCRFFVRIKDTPATSKTDYKIAMNGISTIFRYRGAFQ